MGAGGHRYGDGASLERKIRSAGRSWTIGDITAVGEGGQWAIGVAARRQAREEAAAAIVDRVRSGERIEVSLDALIRAAGLQGPDDADRVERER